MHRYLEKEALRKLQEEALNAGLADDKIRQDWLLSNLSSPFVFGLTNRDTPLEQINTDLQALNSTPMLDGGAVPFEEWLESAVYFLTTRGHLKRTFFQSQLDDVAQKAIGVRADMAAQGIDIGEHSTDMEPEAGLERMVHRDDMLPFDFIEGCIETGKSVARILTPRYNNGTASKDRRGRPLIGKGTGWLIGQKHVITNHHVINSRGENEANATEDDLRLQASNTTVQFDYDEENSDGTPCAVASICAWSEWNADERLDYALLELETAIPESDRPRLPLSPRQMKSRFSNLVPDDPSSDRNMAVNIIQHPGGNPKSFGIRNNLVAKIDEHDLYYFTDTKRGSSGSPVMTDAWQVVALHKSWASAQKKVAFQGKAISYSNRGTRIDRLIESLKDRTYRNKNLWEQIGAIEV